MASKICRGIILFFLFSRQAVPDNSRSSAAKYSKTAAVKTVLVAEILLANYLCFIFFEILETGNIRPDF